jgi:hypothetical protein
MKKSVTCILQVNGSDVPQAFHRDYFTIEDKVKQDIWDFAISVYEQINSLEQCLKINAEDILVEELAKTPDTNMLELLGGLRQRRLNEIEDKKAVLRELEEGKFTFECQMYECPNRDSCNNLNLKDRKSVVAEAHACVAMS